MKEAAEKDKVQKIMDIHRNEPVFRESGASMDFDIIRYVSIFLRNFGHKFHPENGSKSDRIPITLISAISSSM